MTSIYFVRHAQPDHNWENDKTRPLTLEGQKDRKEVATALRDIQLNYAISSPYLRSIDTIIECANYHGLEIHTDERFREREKGASNANTREMIRKRWSDFSFHEEGGESLQMVQDRNMEALWELIDAHPNESIILGTHGTALSTILHYFDPTYNADSFFRIIDYMPYIIRLDFEGRECIGKQELLIIEKEFKK